MDDPAGKRRWASGFFAGIVATFVGLALLGLTAIYTGAYNVAATRGHTPLERWALDATMHNAVRRRADRAADFETSADALAAGAAAYKSYCAHCHAGPGVERAEWAQGLLPHPPRLADAATQWRKEEVLWIVRHGIRLSSMPAFGPHHEEEELRNIAAFVERLPEMTAEEYASFQGEHEHDGAGAAKGKSGG